MRATSDHRSDCDSRRLWRRPLATALALASACLVAATASGAPPPPPPDQSFDFCSKIAVRPDSRFEKGHSGCTPIWSDDAIAAGADAVMIGSHNDVDRVGAVEHPAPSCGYPETHRDAARYVARLRALRAKRGGPPLRVIHMHRFDLVPDTLAAEPGFRASFLLQTDRPFREVTDFLAKDPSPRCGPEGCRWSDAYGGWEDRGRGTWLRDWILKAGGRPESVVYYMVRPVQVEQHYWPLAAIADLRNPAYRAWRAALAKRALEVGGYDAIELNHKFHQFHEPYWLDSPKVPTPAALRALDDDTVWTAPPRDYGFAAYAAGWSAMAADLRAAGVPYAVEVPTWPWLSQLADDPSTPNVDESKLLREAIRGARYVILERWARADVQGLDAFAAELERGGSEVMWRDMRCGFKTP